MKIISLMVVMAVVSSPIPAQPRLSAHTINKSEFRLQTPQHPELDEARRLNQRAVTLHQEGKYEEALPLAKRALDLAEKALGQDSPHMASLLLNVAEIYLARKKHGDARPYFQRALTISEKTTGPDSLQVGKVLDRLAVISLFQRDDKDAESYLLRVLAIKERSLGQENAEVALALLNLADFYRSRRNYAKAEPIFLHAIAISDKLPEQSKPDTPKAIDRYLCFLHESKGVDEAWQSIKRFMDARRSPSEATAPVQVLNGKATRLPIPKYPPEARAVRGSGVVRVKVTIDESGKVIETKALCGHPVFARVAERAAAQARFRPTSLSGVPVKVTGEIVYRFIDQ